MATARGARPAAAIVVAVTLLAAGAPVGAAVHIGEARYRAACDGSADATAALARAAKDAAGQTLVVPAGCTLLLASPGAGKAAITFASGTHLVCESRATFRLARAADGGAAVAVALGEPAANSVRCLLAPSPKP